MKIIVWGINYTPELTGIAPYNAVLCEHLASRGDQVRMVTAFAYYPAWKKQESDRGKFWRTDLINGVWVHRCWHYVPKKVSALKRVLHEGSFVLVSFIRLLFLPRPDMMLVVSPPLLLGAAACVISFLKRHPFVFHVQDLQPDAAVGLRMLKPGLFTRALYALESLAYRKAARVSGISEGMCKAFLSKNVSPDKVILFPNGVVLPPLGTIRPDGEFRRAHCFSSEDFLAVYSGNLGVKQGLPILVAAAKRLKSTRIKIIICGEGAARADLLREIEAAHLENVRLLPLQPEHQYHAMLKDADLMLIPQLHGSGAAFLPCKLLSALAHAKPILAIADSDSALARALNNGGFGRCIPSEDPDSTASALEEMAANKETLETFSQNGRRYVERFEMDAILRRFASDLEILHQIPPESLILKTPC
jgi:colanic acid biosynthesis glycosyl transferase WcaI